MRSNEGPDDGPPAGPGPTLDLTGARVLRLSVPMHGSFGSAHHRDFSTMTSTAVLLESRAGVVGVGTADATPGYSVQSHDAIAASLREDVLPALLADPPAHPNALLDRLAPFADAPNACCAAELAFLDAHGRASDRRLADLLGGARRETVPLNGWVGIDDPEAMAADATDWADRGFESLKIKLAGEPGRDVERVAAVCDAVGDRVAVRADVNAGYTVEEAVEVAQAVETYPLVHLEQPVAKDDLDGLAAVTAATSTPIVADECILTPAEAFEVLRRRAADRIKVKALRMSGVLRTRQVLDAAALAGVECVLGHGFGLTPATSAELQLAAAHDNVFGGVESVGPLKMREEPFDSLAIEGGRATLPTGPGLGTPLREDDLDEFVVDSWRVTG
jgi:L-alanine-DL-glutamate epimerase-like enolase superfamily enzyme